MQNIKVIQDTSVKFGSLTNGIVFIYLGAAYVKVNDSQCMKIGGSSLGRFNKNTVVSVATDVIIKE